MYRNLLVPLDASSFGEHALPLALSIARRAGAAVQLVHVFAPPVSVYTEAGMAFDFDLECALKERAQAYLADIGRRVQAASSVPVTTVLMGGTVADSVAVLVEQARADLVVMTTHSRGPLGRFWIGSETDALLRRLPVPMLLVRPTEAAPELGRDVAFKQILLPLDGSGLAEQILEPAADLAKLMEAELTLLRVVQPLLPPDYAEPTVPRPAQVLLERVHRVHDDLRQQAEQYLQQVAERLREQGLSVQTRIAFEDTPAAAILHKAEVLTADLIALATHGRRGLSRLWLGSVADKVLRGGSLPLLIYRPRSS